MEREEEREKGADRERQEDGAGEHPRCLSADDSEGQKDGQPAIDRISGATHPLALCVWSNSAGAQRKQKHGIT